MRSALMIFLVGMSCLIGSNTARADSWTKIVTSYVSMKANAIRQWKGYRDATCAAIADKKKAAACIIFYNAVINQGESDKQMLEALLAAAVLPKSERDNFRAIIGPMYNQTNKISGALAKQVLALFPRVVKTGMR